MRRPLLRTAAAHAARPGRPVGGLARRSLAIGTATRQWSWATLQYLRPLGCPSAAPSQWTAHLRLSHTLRVLWPTTLLRQHLVSPFIHASASKPNQLASLARASTALRNRLAWTSVLATTPGIFPSGIVNQPALPPAYLQAGVFTQRQGARSTTMPAFKRHARVGLQGRLAALAFHANYLQSGVAAGAPVAGAPAARTPARASIQLLRPTATAGSDQAESGSQPSLGRRSEASLGPASRHEPNRAGKMLAGRRSTPPAYKGMPLKTPGDAGLRHDTRTFLATTTVGGMLERAGIPLFRRGAAVTIRTATALSRFSYSHAIQPGRPGKDGKVPWAPNTAAPERRSGLHHGINASASQNLRTRLLLSPSFKHVGEQAAAPLAKPAATMALQRYPAKPAGGFSYRHPPRAATVDIRKQAQLIERQLQRKIMHEIVQATPWRGQLEQALLSPQLVHSLAERVSGVLAQRSGLERYRRGL
ncbi:hypothetical protein FNU76_17545 [Chitinimonas arctica]|uniref:Uncharacterized protein n=1 Tax=Chitinimonas arctica TaxID=2594795 RepID=A0A516SIN8_9NEIS|nr:hypothetical protein [Chitinimonas arctica]QDQ28003.1 hypothetical protein FNU76_17545 [Chitinimonas arctica]